MTTKAWLSRRNLAALEGALLGRLKSLCARYGIRVNGYCFDGQCFQFELRDPDAVLRLVGDESDVELASILRETVGPEEMRLRERAIREADRRYKEELERISGVRLQQEERRYEEWQREQRERDDRRRVEALDKWNSMGAPSQAAFLRWLGAPPRAKGSAATFAGAALPWMRGQKRAVKASTERIRKLVSWMMLDRHLHEPAQRRMPSREEAIRYWYEATGRD